jgi:hypothetical protein
MLDGEIAVILKFQIVKTEKGKKKKKREWGMTDYWLGFPLIYRFIPYVLHDFLFVFCLLALLE